MINFKGVLQRVSGHVVPLHSQKVQIIWQVLFTQLKHDRLLKVAFHLWKVEAYTVSIISMGSLLQM